MLLVGSFKTTDEPSPHTCSHLQYVLVGQQGVQQRAVLDGPSHRTVSGHSAVDLDAARTGHAAGRGLQQRGGRMAFEEEREELSCHKIKTACCSLQ